MHNYVHHRTNLPTAFIAYLEENKFVHHHDTRQKDDFHFTTVQSEIGKRSIKFKGSRLWNNLPNELKIVTSLQSFKYKLKNHLLQSLS